ncbi:MAG: hypothetical protein FWD45_05690 [Coriobacteriia bacterium]|nr:hypothetical protein [Coriobacteriia bacterium]
MTVLDKEKLLAVLEHRWVMDLRTNTLLVAKDQLQSMIESGDYDIEPETVTLGDGNVVAVGDSVMLVGIKDIRDPALQEVKAIVGSHVWVSDV